MLLPGRNSFSKKTGVATAKHDTQLKQKTPIQQVITYLLYIYCFNPAEHNGELS